MGDWGPRKKETSGGSKSVRGMTWDFVKKTRKMNAKPEDRVRYQLRNKDLQRVFGGLPGGLTLFFGRPGSGKSVMARAIACELASHGEDVVYIYSETLDDVPNRRDYPNIHTFDYTTPPEWPKVVDEIKMIIDQLKPRLLVIDSGTEVFSHTKKALKESDVREATFKLHKMVDRARIMCIVTSEVRGYGLYEGLAGGQGVAHACKMLVKFMKLLVDAPWEREKYDRIAGVVVYSLIVEKDRHNMAKSNTEFIVRFHKDDKMLLEPRLAGVNE